MKTSEVLKILRITRPQLLYLQTKGIISATKTEGGQLDWNNQDVHDYANSVKNIIAYCRVANNSELQNLKEQIKICSTYICENNLNVAIKTDVTDILFTDFTSFKDIICSVLRGEIDAIIVSSADILIDCATDAWLSVLEQCGCKLIELDKINSNE